MNRNTLSAAALAACALILSPVSFAEESPAFVAHFSSILDQANSAAAERAVARQPSTDSHRAHATMTSEKHKDS
jgi:isoaspartyl peptidase/L-asparaginase-like protein (Ntn-hydrolase superfamily)